MKGQKCDAATQTQVMVESVWGGHAVSPFYDPPQPHLLPFFLNTETLGARLAVTAVSGMLGGRCGHFPGLHLHLRLSDTGARIHYTSGRAAQSAL